MAQKIFITGGTGYMGRHLIPILLRDGCEVTAVVRKGSEQKLPFGAIAVVADVLDSSTYAERLTPDHTFVQLVGVAHPSPAKAKQFVEIDQKSAMQAIRSARRTGTNHFVYVSVAHPAPAMRAYIAARSACEDAIREAGLNASILRPWYVLGPGHYWPYALLPFYKLAERIPAYSEGARRLGLMTLEQMVRALLFAIQNPPAGIEILDVPRMRSIGRA